MLSRFTQALWAKALNRGTYNLRNPYLFEYSCQVIPITNRFHTPAKKR